ncbi:MAG: hypothetical protein J0G30_11030 [Actinomycetales bacterium]|nr:hypothetical protein [Actinomycetales bacterium]
MTAAPNLSAPRAPSLGSRVGIAAVAGLVVVAILAVQGLLGWLLGWMSGLALGQGIEGMGGPRQVLALFQAAAFSWVPYGLGVFLAFALVVPIGPGSAIGRTLLRAVLAALLGAGVAWIGMVVGDLLLGSFVASMFGGPQLSVIPYRFVNALQMFVATAPVVALVALVAARWPVVTPAAPPAPTTPEREV